MIHEVFQFNQQVLRIHPSLPTPLVGGRMEWLTMALEEEIRELHEAESTAEQVDALIDLAYFAIGGLCRIGLTEDQAKACFDTVHQYNMRKSTGVKAGREVEGVSDAIQLELNLPRPEIIMVEILYG